MQIVWWLLMHGNNTGKSQVRNQLQGNDFATLDPSLIGTAGGRVFLNPKTGNDQTAVITIAETFRGVHLPSLGQFIPQSGEFFSETVADTPQALISPTDNQVFKIDTIGVQNGSLGALTATVSIKAIFPSDDEVIIATESVAAGTTKTVSLQNPIYIDSNATLTVVATGSIAFTIYAYKVVQ